MNHTQKIGWEAAGLTHLSPSQLTRPIPSWIFQYVYLDKSARRQITVGLNAALGTAVHEGVQKMLCDGFSLEEAGWMAQFEFDIHEADDD